MTPYLFVVIHLKQLGQDQFEIFKATLNSPISIIGHNYL
jgi:hypothetical protein